MTRASDDTSVTASGGLTATITQSLTVHAASPSAMTPATSPPTSSGGPSAGAGSDGGRRPTTFRQEPIPRGEQAVDAMGLEIFVPDRLVVDPPCPGQSVSRPAYGFNGAPACGAPTPPYLMVWMATADDLIHGAVPARSLTHCVARPVLDGETGCVVEDTIRDATSTVLSAIWTKHGAGVEIQVDRHHEEWARSIFDSAHWVPIDRHGCVATRDPVGLPRAPWGPTPPCCRPTPPH